MKRPKFILQRSEKEGNTKGIFRDHNDDLACIHASIYNTFLVSAVGFAIRGATRGYKAHFDENGDQRSS